MKALNLTDVIKKHKNGWIAIDEQKRRIVASAKDFEGINKAVKSNKNVFIMPATKVYSGFIT